MIPRREHEELVELARRVVQNDLIVADMEDRAWLTSLALILGGVENDDLKNVGIVLVPMGPHHSMPWINNTAPGCTVQAILVHKEDFDDLNDTYRQMMEILYQD